MSGSRLINGLPGLIDSLSSFEHTMSIKSPNELDSYGTACDSCGLVVPHVRPCGKEHLCYTCHDRKRWRGLCFEWIDEDDIRPFLRVDYDPSSGERTFRIAPCLECGKPVDQNPFTKMNYHLPIEQTPENGGYSSYVLLFLHMDCVDKFLSDVRYFADSHQEFNERVRRDMIKTFEERGEDIPNLDAPWGAE